MDDMGKYPGLVLRGSVFYYRRRVPEDVRNGIAANRERWNRLSVNPGAPLHDWRELLQEDGTVRGVIIRSLKTGERPEAERRYLATASSIANKLAEIVARMSAEEPIATDDHLREIASRYYSDRTRGAEAEFGALTADQSQIVENWREDLAAIASGSDVFRRALMSRAAGLLSASGFVADAHTSSTLGGYLMKAERTFLEQQIWEWETEQNIWDRDQEPAERPKVAALLAQSEGSRPDVAAAPERVPRPPRRLVSMRDVYKRYLVRKATADRHHKTLGKYDYVWRLIEDCFNVDKPMSEISRDDTSRFEDILRRLPPNWRKNKRLKGLRAPEVAVEASRLGMKPIGPNTLYGYLSNLSAFFAWAEAEDFVEKNLAHGLAEKPTGKTAPSRVKFEDDDLSILFGANYRTEARKYGGLKPPPPPDELPDDPRYWAPIVSLFTGMRLAEICQLTRKEVREFDGVPCIVTMWDVSDETDYDDREEDKVVRSMKSAAAQRAIPLVDELLRLGFWEFAKRLPDGSSARLFPALKPNKHGYIAAPISRWFNRYKATAGVTDTRKVFHSLRHTFRSAMARAEVSHDIAVRVGGWSSRGLSDHYGRSDNLVKLAHQQLNRIRYERLDLSHLYPPAIPQIELLREI